jgi:LmbE family N-acetylglucosaminyl deacetylase
MMILVSAHLDDAVLSCGDLVWQFPGSLVLTVFAGRDVDWAELREWDAATGFTPGTDVMAARIAEDDCALALLGGTARRLDFLDEQYREPEIDPPPEVVGREIAALVREVGADKVLFPLGIGHWDHQITAQAAAYAATNLPDREWYAYQDLPYGYEYEPEVDRALAALADWNPVPVQLAVTSDLDRKNAALDQYPSQMTGLGEKRRADALKPERYWALSPR